MNWRSGLDDQSRNVAWIGRKRIQSGLTGWMKKWKESGDLYEMEERQLMRVTMWQAWEESPGWCGIENWIAKMDWRMSSLELRMSRISDIKILGWWQECIWRKGWLWARCWRLQMGRADWEVPWCSSEDGERRREGALKGRALRSLEDAHTFPADFWCWRISEPHWREFGEIISIGDARVYLG